MISKFKKWLKGANLKGDYEEVESIVVYCDWAKNYTMCFRKKGTAINFKCPLCNKYVPNGRHTGCVLV